MYLVSVLLLVLVYLVAGFYPFKLAPVSRGQLDNGAISTPENELHLRAPGIAYTEQAPAWLPQAIAISDFALSLEVRASDRDQYGPARIFTLSVNPYLRNFMVGQQGTALSVRVRTQQTNLNGRPDYMIGGVFSDRGWHQIDIRISEQVLEIRVDGDTLVVAPMPYRPLEVWDSGYRLALGNELSGDRPWLGQIRKAVVRVGDESFDCLAPDSLHFPETVSVERVRVGQIVPFVNHRFNRGVVVDWAVNLLGFVPFGWLVGMLRRPRPGILLATILAAGISTTIETSQLLFLVDRSPSTEDLILNTLGGAVGAWIARYFDFSVTRRPG
ncbi:MAG: VanZ family protein [Pseudomonadota bacterium]|nr:VanZ family protein [Pseudomonadota bacterium]